jgi:hypothetical protein
MEYVRNLRKRKMGYASIRGMGEEIEVEALPSDLLVHRINPPSRLL